MSKTVSEVSAEISSKIGSPFTSPLNLGCKDSAFDGDNSVGLTCTNLATEGEFG